MKKISQLIFTTLAFALVFSLPQMSAQNNATVSQKVTDKNGNVTIKKKRLKAGENVNDYLESIDFGEGMNVEVTVSENGNTSTFVTSGDIDQSELEVEMEVVEQMMQDLEKEMAKVHEKKHKKYHYNYNYNYNYSYDHHDTGKKRALLGIYPNYTDEGVMIGSLVSGGGAQAAGLQRGDQVASINGEQLETGSDLRRELSKYEPGTVVTVAYVRDGQTFTTQSKLGAKNSNGYHRDPCKIFIGVQLSSAQRGVYINGVIDGTAADKSDVQKGDIILEMDGIAVNSFDELLLERNKHQPGDDFVLTVLRNDQVRIVEAQFLSCDEEEEIEEVIEEVIEPTVTPEVPAEFTNNELQLEELKTFPNPTYGKLSLRFKGEAVPTNIRITDITGKVVHTENLSGFDGYYSRELDIENAAPGNMIVTVKQGNKVISEQVLLLPRA